MQQSRSSVAAILGPGDHIWQHKLTQDSPGDHIWMTVPVVLYYHKAGD